MNNNPLKLLGGILGQADASQTAGAIGSNVLRGSGSMVGALGFLNRLTQRKKGGSVSRLKNLEKRVGSLENAGSQSPQQQTMNKAMAARTGQVQGTVPYQAVGAAGGALAGATTNPGMLSGAGQFNPATMQINNNALSSDPLEGINKIPEIISAPGPMTNSEDELGQLFEN